MNEPSSKMTAATAPTTDARSASAARSALALCAGDETLAFAALSAGGVTPSFQAAVMAAGGPLSVLSDGALVGPRGRRVVVDVARARAGAAFARDYRAAGGEVVASAALPRLGPAPLVVFCRGPAASSMVVGPSVAIVGTRAPSVAGFERARALAASCAEAGLWVVSGGAPGIDTAAHEGALQAGGRTVSILGTRADLDDERPPALRALLSAHPTRALSLSPWGPWVPPGPHLFAARNRFIAALGDVVVVIEGREGSGALLTAEEAHKRGVVVFAVPGDVDDPRAYAPNALLASGRARALLPDATAPAILQGAPPPPPRRASRRRQLALPIGSAADPDGSAEEPATDSDSSPDSSPDSSADGSLDATSDATSHALPDAARALLAVLSAGPLSVEQAAAALATSVSSVLGAAGVLELEGLLARDVDGRLRASG